MPEAAVPASLRHRSRASLRSAMYLHPCRQKKARIPKRNPGFVGGYTVSQKGMSSSKSGAADPADDVDDSAMAGAESPAA
jgi:hypothetical protein